MADIVDRDVLFFFEGRRVELGLYERFAEAAAALAPGMEIRVQKTQISFYDRRMFACVSFAPVRRKAERPARYITISFGLEAPLENPRAVPVMIRANRWTHHVIVGDAEEIDGELMGWIDAAHRLAE